MKGNARFVFWSSSPGDLLAGKRLSCFQLFIESSLFSSRICIFAFEVHDVNFFVARVPSKNFFPAQGKRSQSQKPKRKKMLPKKKLQREQLHKRKMSILIPGTRFHTIPLRYSNDSVLNMEPRPKKVLILEMRLRLQGLRGRKHCSWLLPSSPSK